MSQMKYNSKVLLIGAIFLLFMSALHSHILPAPFYFDWDVNNAMVIVGAISFILSSLLIPASSKRKLCLYLELFPFIFAISFCLLEVLTEFDPNNISKGFGILYLIVCYLSGFIGTAFGLSIGLLIRRKKR